MKFCFLILLLAFAGCAKHPRYSAEPIVSITLDEGIEDDHRELMDLDLRTMSWAKITGMDDSGIFDNAELSKENLGRWLGERVKAVVGEHYDLSRNAFGKEKFVYKPEVFAQEDAFIVMQNLGTAIYLAGKKKNILAGMYIAGKQFVIDSPRVGILQFGPGHFNQRTVGSVGRTNNLSSSFRRLSTIYHEARHSDGHGETLGFQHVNCLSGNYQGQPACDKYSNGPYSAGLIILEKLAPLCDDCSYDEKEGLAMLIADLHTRVQEKAFGDPRPEKVKF